MDLRSLGAGAPIPRSQAELGNEGKINCKGKICPCPPPPRKTLNKNNAQPKIKENAKWRLNLTFSFSLITFQV